MTELMSSPINATNGIHSTAATTSAVAAPSEVLVSMPLLQQTGKVIFIRESYTTGCPKNRTLRFLAKIFQKLSIRGIFMRA
jgi:hypothetical protein